MPVLPGASRWHGLRGGGRLAGVRPLRLGVSLTVVLIAVAVRWVSGASAGYADVFAPAAATVGGVVLGAIAGVVAMRGSTRRSQRRATVPAVAAISLLVWTSGGLVFDLLRIAALLGVPGLPPDVDWVGFAVRAAAFSATVQLVLLLRALVRREDSGAAWNRFSARERIVVGAVTASLATPYPLLKIHWWAGGSIAASARGTTPVEFPVGETMIFALAATTALALTTRIGQGLPSRVLRAIGWVASATLITTGGLAAFGTVAQALGWVAVETSYDGAWIVDVMYGSWLLLGLGLVVCTLTHPTAAARHDPARHASADT